MESETPTGVKFLSSNAYAEDRIPAVLPPKLVEYHQSGKFEEVAKRHLELLGKIRRGEAPLHEPDDSDADSDSDSSDSSGSSSGSDSDSSSEDSDLDSDSDSDMDDESVSVSSDEIAQELEATFPDTDDL